MAQFPSFSTLCPILQIHYSWGASSIVMENRLNLFLYSVSIACRMKNLYLAFFFIREILSEIMPMQHWKGLLNRKQFATEERETNSTCAKTCSLGCNSVHGNRNQTSPCLSASERRIPRSHQQTSPTASASTPGVMSVAIPHCQCPHRQSHPPCSHLEAPVHWLHVVSLKLPCDPSLHLSVVFRF